MKLFNCVNCVKIVSEQRAEETVQLAVLDLQRNLRSLCKNTHDFSIVYKTSDTSAIFIQTKPIGEPESYEVRVDDEKVLITGSDTIEEKLPNETISYFRQFLKYQTRHMQLLTEFAIRCQALVDETFAWEERKAQGEYGYSRLKQLLEERKVLEEGKWENWHRGDRKLELPMYLDRMRNYILAREKEV